MNLTQILNEQPEILEEAVSTSITSMCRIGVNMEDADFWLTRKGTEKAVGKPVKDFTSENIGVKVTATDKVNPDYLFYVFMHLHQSGYWQAHAHGTLGLKNISVSDVKSLKFGLQ